MRTDVVQSLFQGHAIQAFDGKGGKQLDTALHEWAGLIAYRLTGKTDALIPKP